MLSEVKIPVKNRNVLQTGMSVKSSASLNSISTKIFYSVMLGDTETLIALLMGFIVHLSFLFLHF